MPQSYWSDRAISVDEVLWSADNYGTPRSRVIPTIGTSTFPQAYPPELYASQLINSGVQGWNVWLLESTTDDVLRALAPAIPR